MADNTSRNIWDIFSSPPNQVDPPTKTISDGESVAASSDVTTPTVTKTNARRVSPRKKHSEGGTAQPIDGSKGKKSPSGVFPGLQKLKSKLQIGTKPPDVTCAERDIGTSALDGASAGRSNADTTPPDVARAGSSAESIPPDVASLGSNAGTTPQDVATAGSNAETTPPDVVGAENNETKVGTGYPECYELLDAPDAGPGKAETPGECRETTSLPVSKLEDKKEFSNLFSKFKLNAVATLGKSDDERRQMIGREAQPMKVMEERMGRCGKVPTPVNKSQIVKGVTALNSVIRTNILSAKSSEPAGRRGSDVTEHISSRDADNGAVDATNIAFRETWLPGESPRASGGFIDHGQGDCIVKSQKQVEEIISGESPPMKSKTVWNPGDPGHLSRSQTVLSNIRTGSGESKTIQDHCVKDNGDKQPADSAPSETTVTVTMATDSKPIKRPNKTRKRFTGRSKPCKQQHTESKDNQSDDLKKHLHVASNTAGSKHANTAQNEDSCRSDIKRSVDTRSEVVLRPHGTEAKDNSVHDCPEKTVSRDLTGLCDSSNQLQPEVTTGQEKYKSVSERSPDLMENDINDSGRRSKAVRIRRKSLKYFNEDFVVSNTSRSPEAVKSVDIPANENPAFVQHADLRTKADNTADTSRDASEPLSTDAQTEETDEGKGEGQRCPRRMGARKSLWRPSRRVKPAGLKRLSSKSDTVTKETVNEDNDAAAKDADSNTFDKTGVVGVKESAGDTPTDCTSSPETALEAASRDQNSAKRRSRKRKYARSDVTTSAPCEDAEPACGVDALPEPPDTHARSTPDTSAAAQTSDITTASPARSAAVLASDRGESIKGSAAGAPRPNRSPGGRRLGVFSLLQRQSNQAGKSTVDKNRITDNSSPGGVKLVSSTTPLEHPLPAPRRISFKWNSKPLGACDSSSNKSPFKFTITSTSIATSTSTVTKACAAVTTSAVKEVGLTPGESSPPKKSRLAEVTSSDSLLNATPATVTSASSGIGRLTDMTSFPSTGSDLINCVFQISHNEMHKNSSSISMDKPADSGNHGNITETKAGVKTEAGVSKAATPPSKHCSKAVEDAINSILDRLVSNLVISEDESDPLIEKRDRNSTPCASPSKEAKNEPSAQEGTSDSKVEFQKRPGKIRIIDRSNYPDIVESQRTEVKLQVGSCRPKRSPLKSVPKTSEVTSSLDAAVKSSPEPVAMTSPLEAEVSSPLETEVTSAPGVEQKEDDLVQHVSEKKVSPGKSLNKVDACRVSPGLTGTLAREVSPRRSKRSVPHKFIAKRGEPAKDIMHQLLDDDVGIEEVFEFLQARESSRKSPANLLLVEQSSGAAVKASVVKSSEKRDEKEAELHSKRPAVKTEVHCMDKLSSYCAVAPRDVTKAVPPTADDVMRNLMSTIDEVAKNVSSASRDATSGSYATTSLPGPVSMGQKCRARAKSGHNFETTPIEMASSKKSKRSLSVPTQADDCGLDSVKSVSDILKEWEVNDQRQSKVKGQKDLTAGVKQESTVGCIVNAEQNSTEKATVDVKQEVTVEATVCVKEEPNTGTTDTTAVNASPGHVGVEGADSKAQYTSVSPVSTGETSSHPSHVSGVMATTDSCDVTPGRNGAPAIIVIQPESCNVPTTGGGGGNGGCVTAKRRSRNGEKATPTKPINYSAFVTTQEENKKYLRESADHFLSTIAMQYKQKARSKKKKRLARKNIFTKFNIPLSTKLERLTPHHVVPGDTEIRVFKLKLGQCWKEHLYNHKKLALKMPPKLIPIPKKVPDNLNFEVPDRYLKVEASTVKQYSMGHFYKVVDCESRMRPCKQKSECSGTNDNESCVKPPKEDVVGTSDQGPVDKVKTPGSGYYSRLTSDDPMKLTVSIARNKAHTNAPSDVNSELKTPQNETFELTTSGSSEATEIRTPHKVPQHTTPHNSELTDLNPPHSNKSPELRTPPSGQSQLSNDKPSTEDTLGASDAVIGEKQKRAPTLFSMLASTTCPSQATSAAVSPPEGTSCPPGGDSIKAERDAARDGPQEQHATTPALATATRADGSGQSAASSVPVATKVASVQVAPHTRSDDKNRSFSTGAARKVKNIPILPKPSVVDLNAPVFINADGIEERVVSGPQNGTSLTPLPNPDRFKMYSLLRNEFISAREPVVIQPMTSAPAPAPEVPKAASHRDALAQHVNYIANTRKDISDVIHFSQMLRSSESQRPDGKDPPLDASPVVDLSKTCQPYQCNAVQISRASSMVSLLSGAPQISYAAPPVVIPSAGVFNRVKIQNGNVALRQAAVSTSPQVPSILQPETLQKLCSVESLSVQLFNVQQVQSASGETRLVINNVPHLNPPLKSVPYVPAAAEPRQKLADVLARLAEDRSGSALIGSAFNPKEIVTVSSDSENEHSSNLCIESPEKLFEDLKEKSYLPLAQQLKNLCQEEKELASRVFKDGKMGSKGSALVDVNRNLSIPLDAATNEKSSSNKKENRRQINNSQRRKNSSGKCASEKAAGGVVNSSVSRESNGPDQTPARSKDASVSHTDAQKSRKARNSPGGHSENSSKASKQSPKKRADSAQKSREGKQTSGQQLSSSSASPKKCTTSVPQHSTRSTTASPRAGVRESNQAHQSPAKMSRSSPATPKRGSPYKPRQSPRKRAGQQKDRPVRPKKNRMLEQLKSSAGYVADIEKKNENLFQDIRQLNREERHLQRALMDIAQREQEEAMAAQSATQGKRPAQNATETKRTAQNATQTKRLAQNVTLSHYSEQKLKDNRQKRANALKKKAVLRSNKARKRNFEDFEPQILEHRTRFHKATAMRRPEVRQKNENCSREEAPTPPVEIKKEVLDESRTRSPEDQQSPAKRMSPEKQQSPAKRMSLEKQQSPAKRMSPEKRQSPARRVSPEKRQSPARRVSPEKRKSLDKHKSSHLNSTVERLQAHIKSPKNQPKPSASLEGRTGDGVHDDTATPSKGKGVGKKTPKVVVPKWQYGDPCARDRACDDGPSVTGSSVTDPSYGDWDVKTVKVKREITSDSEIVELSVPGHEADDEGASVQLTPKTRRKKVTSRKSGALTERVASPLVYVDRDGYLPSPFHCQRFSDKLHPDDDAMSVSTTFSVDGNQVKIPLEVKKVHVVRETGESVLHKAARQGLRDVILWCCQTGYADPGGQDHAGFAPLHESCATSHIDITKILLAYGADVNVPSKKDGIRPLHDAVISDDIETVRLLLSCGADPHLRTYSGKDIMDMIRSSEMRQFLTACFAEHNEDSSAAEPWTFRDYRVEGEDSSDEEETGQDLFADVPSDSDDEGDREVAFECSEHPLIPTYRLCVQESVGPGDYALLLDILQCLGMSKMEFTSQMNMYVHQMPWYQFAAALAPCSAFSARCRWMPEEGRKRKFPVDLVRWEERLQDLLGVEIMPLGQCRHRKSRSSNEFLPTPDDDFDMVFSDDEEWECMVTTAGMNTPPRPLSLPPTKQLQPGAALETIPRPFSLPFTTSTNHMNTSLGELPLGHLAGTNGSAMHTGPRPFSHSFAAGVADYTTMNTFRACSSLPHTASARASGYAHRSHTHHAESRRAFPYAKPLPEVKSEPQVFIGTSVNNGGQYDSGMPNTNVRSDRRKETRDSDRKHLESESDSSLEMVEWNSTISRVADSSNGPSQDSGINSLSGETIRIKKEEVDDFEYYSSQKDQNMRICDSLLNKSEDENDNISKNNNCNSNKLELYDYDVEHDGSDVNAMGSASATHKPEMNDFSHSPSLSDN